MVEQHSLLKYVFFWWGSSFTVFLLLYLTMNQLMNPSTYTFVSTLSPFPFLTYGAEAEESSEPWTPLCLTASTWAHEHPSEWVSERAKESDWQNEEEGGREGKLSPSELWHEERESAGARGIVPSPSPSPPPSPPTPFSVQWGDLTNDVVSKHCAEQCCAEGDPLVGSTGHYTLGQH